MILGIGVDTVDIDRFERQLERTPALRSRLFTAGERELPVPSLAARFAAKEALVKALRGSGKLGWHDIPVRRDVERAPYFELTPVLQQELASRGGARVHLSLTHDGAAATAFVVVERHEAPAADGAAGSHGAETATAKPTRTGVRR